MGLTLKLPPGYSDLSDSVLVFDQPALGIDVAKIYTNAAFGMVRPEIFVGVYKNGDTVPTPVSPIDGYFYTRDELNYVWTVHNSVDPASGWITGRDSLYYAAWLVEQTTGQVFSEEWYRRSGSHGEINHTNDGDLWVWTIATRIKNFLVMASSPTYSAISADWIGTDDPLSQQLAQGMNDDAKFSVVNHEIIYLGEFTHGNIVSTAVSPADGYHYGYGEMHFMFSWRWTFGSAVYEAPPMTYGQMGPFTGSVSSVGLVSLAEDFIDNDGNLFTVNVGRIAVFAFCVRSGTPASLPLSNSFTELSYDFFMPGSTLRASTVQSIVNDIQEAILTPDFFGPTTHQNGDTIALPTSTVDGYVYSRVELTYVWTWSDTTDASGSNLRLASFHGKIDPVSGLVTLGTYRLPPGGPYVVGDSTLPRISVIIVARRQAELPAVADTSTTTPQSDFNTVATDIPYTPVLNHDQFTGDNTTTVWTLSLAPPSGKAMVYWNGVYVRPMYYTISGTTLTTAFVNESGTTQPADLNDDIDVVYFT